MSEGFVAMYVLPANKRVILRRFSVIISFTFQFK